MCRMIIYKGIGLDQSVLLADLVVKPRHSIIHQSHSCYERLNDTGLPAQLNGDGFGIGWFAERLYVVKEMEDGSAARHYRPSSSVTTPRDKRYETPCVFTSISPAWNNKNLQQLADKVSSPLFFAHVRSATIGSSTSETNCHPFTYDKYLWMHNGEVGDFQKIRRKISDQLPDFAYNTIVGTTDSEYCFALFLTKLSEMGPVESDWSAEELSTAMIKTIEAINQICRESGLQRASLLNFALTDGDTVIATRYVNIPSAQASSLYITSGARWMKSQILPGEYIMQREDKVDKAYIIASERVSGEEGDWTKVPQNSIVTITSNVGITIHPIEDSL